MVPGSNRLAVCNTQHAGARSARGWTLRMRRAARWSSPASPTLRAMTPRCSFRVQCSLMPEAPPLAAAAPDSIWEWSPACDIVYTRPGQRHICSGTVYLQQISIQANSDLCTLPFLIAMRAGAAEAAGAGRGGAGGAGRRRTAGRHALRPGLVHAAGNQARCGRLPGITCCARSFGTVLRGPCNSGMWGDVRRFFTPLVHPPMSEPMLEYKQDDVCARMQGHQPGGGARHWHRHYRHWCPTISLCNVSVCVVRAITRAMGRATSGTTTTVAPSPIL